MTDEYRIDSHKLMLHPERVSEWKKGQHIYPIYVEMSPSGTCNHRCSFCAVDFLGYKPTFLDTEKTVIAIENMAKLGVKSIMFGGEGEPFLHKDLAVLIYAAEQAGIDTAVTTNGSVMVTPDLYSIVKRVKWIKVSVNAGCAEDYKKIHGIDHWEKVWGNIHQLVKTRRLAQEYGAKNLATIGVQAVLLEDNYSNIEGLIVQAKKVGVDYVVIKPYSKHPSSNKPEPDLTIFRLGGFEQYNDANFKVIIRSNAMMRMAEKKPYKYCHALPFWSYVQSNGDVWSCSAHMPDLAFRLGNIYTDDLRQIWAPTGKLVSTENCRENCRMDACNRYLEELAHPNAHINFI